MDPESNPFNSGLSCSSLGPSQQHVQVKASGEKRPNQGDDVVVKRAKLEEVTTKDNPHDVGSVSAHKHPGRILTSLVEMKSKPVSNVLPVHVPTKSVGTVSVGFLESDKPCVEEYDWEMVAVGGNSEDDPVATEPLKNSGTDIDTSTRDVVRSGDGLPLAAGSWHNPSAMGAAQTPSKIIDLVKSPVLRTISSPNQESNLTETTKPQFSDTLSQDPLLASPQSVVTTPVLLTEKCYPQSTESKIPPAQNVCGLSTTIAVSGETVLHRPSKEQTGYANTSVGSHTPPSDLNHQTKCLVSAVSSVNVTGSTRSGPQESSSSAEAAQGQLNVSGLGSVAATEGQSDDTELGSPVLNSGADTLNTTAKSLQAETQPTAFQQSDDDVVQDKPEIFQTETSSSQTQITDSVGPVAIATDTALPSRNTEMICMAAMDSQTSPTVTENDSASVETASVNSVQKETTRSLVKGNDGSKEPTNDSSEERSSTISLDTVNAGPSSIGVGDMTLEERSSTSSVAPETVSSEGSETVGSKTFVFVPMAPPADSNADAADMAPDASSAKFVPAHIVGVVNPAVLSAFPFTDSSNLFQVIGIPAAALDPSSSWGVDLSALHASQLLSLGSAPLVPNTDEQAPSSENDLDEMFEGDVTEETGEYMEEIPVVEETMEIVEQPEKYREEREEYLRVESSNERKVRVVNYLWHLSNRLSDLMDPHGMDVQTTINQLSEETLQRRVDLFHFMDRVRKIEEDHSAMKAELRGLAKFRKRFTATRNKRRL